jgi:hypothetical protein
MSEARHSPPPGGERGERLVTYEKRNLENGDSTDSISAHRCGNYTWCDKLRIDNNKHWFVFHKLKYEEDLSIDNPLFYL